MKTRLLVVDDEKEIRVSCRKILSEAGYTVDEAKDGETALELLAAETFDLVLLDLRLPGRSGLEVLHSFRSISDATDFIIFTAYAAIDTAVEAIKLGAFDYLAKPFTQEQLLLAVEKALEHRALRIENLNLRGQLAEELAFGRIIGGCPAMRRVFELIRKVAPSDASVLITGETGTGKELVARTIHANSSRVSGPFVPIDCAALPEQLLESELFGHEKGAFTGADKVKRGLLETAQGGSLFLDEVGDLPLTLQPKLLRTLQERVVRRIGSEKVIPVDVRILAATNHDLAARSRSGEFREELFYRLNVVTLQMPALRERGEDISVLASNFLREFAERYRKPIHSLSPESMRLLLGYAWPGNIRELRNIIERAVLVSNSTTIQAADLPGSMRDEDPAVSFREMRRRREFQIEKPYLVDLLRRHRGNVSTAAQEAGLARKMIYRMARKFGIEIDSFRSGTPTSDD